MIAATDSARETSAKQQSSCLQTGHFSSLFAYLRHSFEISDRHLERFHVVFLDQHHRYIDDRILACGTTALLPIRMRDLFARALSLGACAIIVAHNHPSGDCRPSNHDINATARLRDIAQALEIELLDHLIFTREKVYSMRAGGKL